MTRYLYTAALLDLSLAHNSPRQRRDELAGNVYTNYIQFMDRICTNWVGGIGAEAAGAARRKAIHNSILDQNKNAILDPVYIHNFGVAAEFGTPVKKRKNYAFYEGYSRLYFDYTAPSYTATPGAGIIFRVSDNVSIFPASDDTTNMFSADSILIRGSAAARRIILRADNNTILDRLPLRPRPVGAGQQHRVEGQQSYEREHSRPKRPTPRHRLRVTIPPIVGTLPATRPQKNSHTKKQ
jgi:hypothetical protein